MIDKAELWKYFVWFVEILLGSSGFVALYLALVTKRKMRAEAAKLKTEKDEILQRMKIAERESQIKAEELEEARREELQKSIQQQYEMLTKRLRDDNGDLERRVEKNSSLITDLKKNASENEKVIAQLEKDNEECKYQHLVSELEILQIKKQYESHFEKMQAKYQSAFTLKRELVYLVDDDPDILEEFSEKFEKISIIDFKGFDKVDLFLAECNKNHPPIVIIDVKLDHRMADEIIPELQYGPLIYVMSGEEAFRKRFNSQKIKFFEKTDNFVYRIAAEVIKDLTNKI